MQITDNGTVMMYLIYKYQVRDKILANVRGQY